MTNPPRFAANDQRDSLRARIEAAERRNAERTLADHARDAASAAVDYTRANPLTVIGAALAAGLVIGLFTRPGRRVASKALNNAGDAISGAASSARSGVKGIASRGSSKVGSVLGEAALAYVLSVVDQLIETARTGQEGAKELGEDTQARAKKLHAEAAKAVGIGAGEAKEIARSARAKARRMAADLTRKKPG